MLKEKLDNIFSNKELEYDTVSSQFYNIIKKLNSDDAYNLIDEAVAYLISVRDPEVIAYMLEFISSLYGIAGTHELTEFHQLKASVIERQVEMLGDQFTKNVLNNLQRELGIAR